MKPPIMESTTSKSEDISGTKPPKGYSSAGKALESAPFREPKRLAWAASLHTPDPPTEGSVIELLFDLKAGEVRTRAIVRHRLPGEGMGVQFVQMQSADRARLNQFLLQCSEGKPFAESAARRVAATPSSDRKAPLRNDAEVIFDRELNRLLQGSKRDLLPIVGVAADAPGKEIRTNFYRLARQFHPDYHMGKPEWMPALKELIGVATSAYKSSLSMREKRAEYDAHLSTLGSFSSTSRQDDRTETIEQCFSRANECLRAGNFVGFYCLAAQVRRFVARRGTLPRTTGAQPKHGEPVSAGSHPGVRERNRAQSVGHGGLHAIRRAL